MAFIEIKSTNKESFSWVLEKNPETQLKEGKPLIKKLRLGKVFGWFGEDTETTASYNLFFKDAIDKNSFNPETTFEYLDQTRYSHPNLILMMLNEMLKSALANEHEADTPEFVTTINTQLMVFSLSVLEKTINSLNKNPNISIEYNPVFGAEKIYYGYSVSISVKANGIRLALNTLFCLAYFQHLMNLKFNESANQDQIVKFVKVLNYLDVDYYLRYLFSSRVISSPKIFDIVKNDLLKQNMFLNYGDSGMHRREAILKIVQNYRQSNMKVIDVGCAELFNSYKVHRKTGCDIIAIDKDSTVMENNQFFVKKKQVEEHFTLINEELNPQWISGHSDLFKDQFVLMTEVIEHMPIDQAKELVQAIALTKPKYIYITTPNKAFNSFYEMPEGEFRHDDHDFEMDEKEFDNWIRSLQLDASNIEFELIGDMVNNIYSSQGVFISF